MAFERLGLFDLLVPQYLAGFDFPEYVHRYLSILGIDEMHTHDGIQAVVYNGILSFSGDGSGAPEISHNDPFGVNLIFPANAIRFRLTIPRDGAAFIGAAFIDIEANSSTDGKLPEVALLLNDLAEGNITEPMTNSDFPGTKFKLELFINHVRFSLGDDWVAGEFDAALHKVVPHSDKRFSGKPVEVLMPGLTFTFSQGDNPDQFAPVFSLDSFMSYGLDAPHDLAIGELIKMEPGIALHTSGHCAFSIEQIVLDSSPENTPAELLAHFGVGDDWQGLFIKQLLFYYNNDQNLGFAVRIADALIGFDGRVSFEAELDIYPNPDVTELTVTPKFFHGPNPIKFFHRGILEHGPEAPPSGDPPGQILLSQGDVMQLDISGAIAPFIIKVMQNGTDLWEANNRRVVFDTPGQHNIYVKVNDSVTPLPHEFREYIKVIVVPLPTPTPPSGTPADRPAATQTIPLLKFSRSGNDTTHDIEKISEEGTLARFRVSGAGNFSVTITQTVGGTTVTPYENAREFSVDVQPGTSYDIAVNYVAIEAGASKNESVYFQNNCPQTKEIGNYKENPDTNLFFGTSFRSFLDKIPDASKLSNVELAGFASNNPSNVDRDITLSKNRVTVVLALLRPKYSVAIMPGPGSYHGHNIAFLPDPSDPASELNRCVRVTFTFAAAPAHSMTGVLSREALTIPPGDDHDDDGIVVIAPTPPAAPPHLNGIPPAIKLLGIRVKIDNNKLSLLELYAKVDFETDLEQKLRETPGSEPDGSLDMSHEGVVDMKLGYVYDRASQETTISVLFHTEEGDTSGLIHFENNENRDSRLKNIAGALLLFAPILNASTEAVIADPEDVGAWITLGTSFGIPVAIGGLNVFRTRKVVLYGVEGKFKWVRPKDGLPGRWDFGIVLDYGVEFDIIVEMLKIGMDRLPPATELPPPLKARYRAIGFNMVRGVDGSAQYKAVFDSSKGYELDLSDPSLFKLPDPLGTLFNVVGARIARFNPTTFEIDFAIKVDLGVITVDRFKLKIPLDPVGTPQIMPSGVRVDIPGVIIGNGFVNIIDADVVQPDGHTISSKGIEGGIDLTLVTLKLRIAATVALGSINDSGREAVAVFVGIKIEFPSPIVIAASGLGLYGLSGLFAMHYRRLEDPVNPTSAVGPALKWLIKSGGEPQNLYNGSVKLWDVAFDRWSFGVGVVLGTLEGGYLINMQGMFVLELPGPRIIIMIKMRLIADKPKVNTDPAGLEVGIIGVIDLDFQQMQLTVGVMINFEIKELLQVSIPVELFFKLNDSSIWHVYLGTISQPASAKVLNIVRGTAYFMIQGNNYVYPSQSPVPAFLQGKTLSGIAIATGISASILLGDPDTIYLKIAAAADLGVSFSPFLIIGTLRIEGKLRLLIVSIGAHGEFKVIVSKKADESFKTYVHGEICGEVDLFFFDISACIGLTIGTEDKIVVPPKLVRGIYLQSYSPVLISGQGGNLKPIDASLGNAVEVNHGEASPSSGLPIVPIDSVIVLQLQVAPELASSLNTNTFSKPIANAPGRPSGDWYKLSTDLQVKYTINSLTLTENNSDYNGEKPPATWRIDRPHQPNGADTAIDLALFSRVPTAAEFAVEQSTELKSSVTIRWENACKEPAPPTRVLYTFCSQPLGASLHGWQVKGIALPDPEGVIRTELPKTQMAVYAPETCGARTSFDLLLAEMGYPYDEPAEIIGDEKSVQTQQQPIPPRQIFTHLTTAMADLSHFRRRVDAVDLTPILVREPVPTPTEFKKCYSLINRRGFELNPATIENELKIFSSSTKARLHSDSIGFLTEDDFLRTNPLDLPMRRDPRLLRGLIGRKGFDIKEFVRIDILVAPVAQVLIEFTASQNTVGTILYAEAYDTEMKLVDRKEWTPVLTPEPQNGNLTLLGKNIKHVLITNKNFTGVLAKICIKRKGSKPEADDGKCSRALQLPWLNVRANKRQEVIDHQKLDPEKIKKYYDQKECCRYVTFDTDACENVIFFGAVYGKFIELIRIQELDDNNKILKEYKLSDADYKYINNPSAELPAKWLDLNLPWSKCVMPVLRFMFSNRFKSYEKILINISPENKEKCKKIRFNVCMVENHFPSMYLAIADLLTMGEIQHNQTLSEIQESDRTTLDAYINDNTPRPLMKPNKTYRLGINYDVTTRVAGTPETIENFDQDFVFQTDDKAPEILGSYVLGATPETGEAFHFYGDELTVIFNDPEVLRLYEAYGKHLSAIIRSADGAPVTNNPDSIHTLEEIPAEVNSPYRTMVEALLQSGLLPCMGNITFKKHGSYKTPYKLKPLMPYIFDIELIETDPVSVPEKAIVPLFRQAFTTSRYESLKDFAKAHRELPVNHRALTADLNGLPVFSEPEQVLTATDKEIQDSLTAAGIPLSQTGITILWGPNGTDFKPVAVILATGEPAWKKRIESEKKTILGNDNQPIDPAFVIYEKRENDHLRLMAEAGENNVKGFIKSTAGTTTIIVLKNDLVIPDSGKSFTINAVRPASSLYGLVEQSETILKLILLTKAPWED